MVGKPQGNRPVLVVADFGVSLLDGSKEHRKVTSYFREDVPGLKCDSQMLLSTVIEGSWLHSH